jgi:hypothetical protein
MDKMRLFAGILLFGSLWGFSECIIGSTLNEAGLPAGAIMTGIFAVTLLVTSRLLYRKPGMQLGMGLVAGTLRIFNPFVGCHLCSALAIMAEGAIFELIWYKIDLDNLKTLTLQSSMGILTAYLVYTGGYILTQILTPVISGPGFYIENLIVLMPNILADGLLPALIGGAVLPATLLVKKIDISIKDRFYYPTAIGLSAFCWLFIVGYWMMVNL